MKRRKTGRRKWKVQKGFTVVNETHWRTDQLRKIAMAAAQKELTVAQRKKMTVYFRHSRKGWYGHRHTGSAYLNSNAITVNLPKEGAVPWKVAYICVHEYAHTKGFRHKDINGLAKYDWNAKGCEEWYEWAKDFPLEKKPPEKKKRKTADDKLAHYEKLVAQWETKLKRAQTYVRKYKKKVADYKRTIKKRNEDGHDDDQAG